MKRVSSYYFLIFIIYLSTFSKLADGLFPILGLADELYACLSFPLILYNLNKRNYRIAINGNRYAFGIFITIFVFVALGFSGNLIFKYQPILQVVLSDLFLNIKFWCSIYVSYCVFKKLDLIRYGKRIASHLKIVIAILFVLTILDLLLDIFPGGYRYGLKSVSLFYGAHTYFAAQCAFLMALLVIVKDKTKNYLLYLFVLIVMMLSTMRVKAFGAVALFVLLYYLIFVLHKKIKIYHIILLAIVGVGIGWSQIQYYFLSDIRDSSARSMLLINCFKVAKDHLPVGAGFATFASYYSGVYYSPLYEMYNLSNIYGITKQDYAFISDSFWPMIVAQNGFLGAFCFIFAIIVLFIYISKKNRWNKSIYFSSVFSLAYLCVSSLAESAFVNPFAIPFAIIIGISFSRKDK